MRSSGEMGSFQVKLGTRLKLLGIMAVLLLLLGKGESTLDILAELGQPCTTPANCHSGRFGNLTTCLTDKTCGCDEKVATPDIENKQCLRLATKIGDACEEAAQCVKGSLKAGGQCVDKTCTCNSNYVDHSDGKQCLPKRSETGDECVDSRQCTDNLSDQAECKDHKCECKPGSQIIGGFKRCLKMNLTIGSECAHVSQCAGGNKVCSDSGYCACKSGFTSNLAGTTCLRVKNELGEECQESAQCQAGKPGHYSHCLNKKCNCTTAAVNEPGEHICYLKAVKVGDPCEKNVQCEVNLDKAYCANQANCRCRPGAVASATGTKCILAKQLGEVCQEDGQCQHVEAAVCRKDSSSVDTICTCNPDGFIRGKKNETRCFRKVANMGDACEEDVECADIGFQESVTCEGKKCSCLPPKIFFNRRCLLAVPINGPCTNHDSCRTGGNEFAMCSGNATHSVCRCLPDTTNEKGFCYGVKRVGDSCFNNRQCQFSIMGPSYCDSEEGKCACEPGYGELLDGEKCAAGIIRATQLALLGGLLLLSKAIS